MRALVLTLYPEMFPGPLGHSLAGRALKEGLWQLETLQIRDFATDKHKTVDDSPYGGGAGMVLKPDVLERAIEAAKARLPEAKLIYFTPRGQVLTQQFVTEAVNNHPTDLILLCGRFEGIDQRVIDHYQMIEISVGDYVLSGGEVAALSFLDACVRLLPGVMGKEQSAAEESFSKVENSPLLLEYPHYTRPPEWKGLAVPEVLLSGNHAEIEAWRQAQREKDTRERRPDLWNKQEK